MNKIKVLVASLLCVIAMMFSFTFVMNVNAETQSSDYITYTVTEKTASWVVDGNFTSNKSFNDKDFDSFGLKLRSLNSESPYAKVNKNKYFEVSAETVLYLPVPANSTGTVKLNMISNSSNGNISIYNGTGASTEEGKTVHYTKTSVGEFELGFDTNDLYLIESSYYIGFGQDFQIKFSGVSVEITNDACYDTADAFEFGAQYNNTTPETSTKLRFIGTIKGVAYTEVDSITNITFSFTFNGNNRSRVIETVYKRVVNGSEVLLPAENGKLYAIFVLNNINKPAYSGLSITNCKFDVTLSNGTVISVAHDDIVLPTFTA